MDFIRNINTLAKEHVDNNKFKPISQENIHSNFLNVIANTLEISAIKEPDKKGKARVDLPHNPGIAIPPTDARGITTTIPTIPLIPVPFSIIDETIQEIFDLIEGIYASLGTDPPPTLEEVIYANMRINIYRGILKAIDEISSLMEGATPEQLHALESIVSELTGTENPDDTLGAVFNAHLLMRGYPADSTSCPPAIAGAFETIMEDLARLSAEAAEATDLAEICMIQLQIQNCQRKLDSADEIFGLITQVIDTLPGPDDYPGTEAGWGKIEQLEEIMTELAGTDDLEIVLAKYMEALVLLNPDIAISPSMPHPFVPTYASFMYSLFERQAELSASLAGASPAETIHINQQISEIKNRTQAAYKLVDALRYATGESIDHIFSALAELFDSEGGVFSLDGVDIDSNTPAGLRVLEIKLSMLIDKWE